MWSARRFPVVSFLDWNYRYKSVATQIPRNGELAPIPYTGRKFLPHQGSNQLILIKSIETGIKEFLSSLTKILTFHFPRFC